MPNRKQDDLEERLLRLESLGADTLARFVSQLAQNDPAVEERVEALLLRADPVRLGKALKKRLGNIKRGRRFIPYRESFEFASKLDRFLEDVEEGLLQTSPKIAAELCESFIEADARIIERVDDSGGDLGMVFVRACGLWARAVSRLPPSTDRVDRLYDLHAANDYGVRDALLDEAATALDELELRRLARRYEQDLQAAIEASSGERSSIDVYTARAALGQVACTLEDAALYERSVLMLSPEPNDLQREGIARNHIRFGSAKKAIEWIEGSGRQDLRLLAEALIKLGNRDRLRDVRKRLFDQTLEPSDLATYLELLPEEERPKAKRDAARIAGESQDLIRGAQLLFELGESDRAEEMVLDRAIELQGAFYSGLLNVAKTAESADRPLTAILCFRALTDQILNEARSKAYRHAQHYCARLLQLEPGIGDRRGTPSHAEYMRGLREKHGRKNSFWRRLEGGEPSA